MAGLEVPARALDESGGKDPVSGREVSRRGVLQLSALGAGALALSACGVPSKGRGSASDNIPARQTGLPPYKTNAPAGKPPDLPHRVAYPNPYNAALFLAVGKYLGQACSDRGLELLTAISDGDPQTMVAQTDGFFARGIGALFETPINIPATDPQMKRAVGESMYTVGVQRPFCNTQVSENQYGIGHAQGLAAVKWVQEKLHGSAKVAYFNEDASGDSLIPRHKGVLAALKTGGSGIEVVSDISAPLTTQAGASAMTAILQAHRDVNVVMGGSGAILGAYAAFKAQNREDDPTVYLSSIAGSDADYALIKQNTIYRATSGEPWNAWAYAIGQLCGDWLEGKSVPTIISVPGGSEPMLTGPSEVADFQEAMDDPRSLWTEVTRRTKYVQFYGNTSYAERSSYLKTIVTP
jgi:ribose transport system substrate-binding protein